MLRLVAPAALLACFAAATVAVRPAHDVSAAPVSRCDVVAPNTAGVATGSAAGLPHRGEISRHTSSSPTNTGAPGERRRARVARDQAQRHATLRLSEHEPELVVRCEDRPLESTRHVTPGGHVLRFYTTDGREIGHEYVKDVLPETTRVVDVGTYAKYARFLATPVECGCIPDEHLESDWFALHQSEDGGFRASCPGACAAHACGDIGPGANVVEDTALVMLAYLACGETHNQGRSKETVKSGLRFLKYRERDRQDGSFRPGGSHPYRSDTIAALAFSEAYGMTASRLFKSTAERALNALRARRIPGHGWKSRPGRGADIEATAWAAFVLRSAQVSELSVRDDELAAALGDVRSFGAPASRSLRECAMLCAARMLLKEDPVTSRPLAAGLDRLSGAQPTTRLDERFAYFASIALHRVGGARWKRFSRTLKTQIVDHQDTSDRARHHGARGSWPRRDGKSAGRLRTTAFSVLTLSVYYRCGRVFGTPAPRPPPPPPKIGWPNSVR